MEKQNFKQKEKHTKTFFYILGISLLVGFAYLVLAAPTVYTVVLNSTSGYNITSDNLTAFPEPDNTSIKKIYNWKKDGSSIAVLNMPFEGGSNSTFTKDYSDGGNNAIVNNGVIHNSSGGYDGKGAYEFDGANDYLSVQNVENFNFSETGEFTVMAWVKPNDLANNNGDVISHYYSTSDDRVWLLQIRNGIARFIGYSDGTFGSASYAIGETLVNDSDTWYHLVGRWNGTGIQVYVNGVADDATPPSLSQIHSMTVRNVRIGLAVGSDDFNGTIDEVMIYNRSLSVEQILALYNNRTDLIVSNETSVGDVWAVEVTPNDGTVDGTSVLSNSLRIKLYPFDLNSVVLNSSLGANTIIENLTAYVSPSDVKVIYNWMVDGAGIALINLPFEAESISSEYLTDYSIYNHSITKGVTGSSGDNPIYNSTGGVDGNGAIYFPEGDNDERVIIMAESGEEISTLGDDVTVMMWVYFDATIGSSHVIYQEWDMDAERWHFFINNNGNLTIYDRIDDGGEYFYSDFQLSSNTWYHVTVVGSGRNWKIYANGNLVLNETGTNGIQDMTHSSRHYIGTRRFSDAYGYEWRGFVDEFMIFNRSLGAEQISTLYNNRTDLIVSQETSVGENWSVMATPVYEGDVGAGVMSNNLTILDVPSVASLVLNTSSGNNYTTEDLTGWVSVVPSDSKTINYWLENGVSSSSLIMPFEYGSNDTWTKDYGRLTPSMLYGVVNDNVTYNATGGYDGKGAYEFDGINGGITAGGGWASDVGLKDDMTFMTWAKYDNLSGDMNLVAYSGIGESSEENYLYQLELKSDKRLNYLHESAAGSDHLIFSTEAADVDAGEWHHYAFVRDDSANTIKFYVDGIQLGNTGTYTIDPAWGANSNFYLGRDAGGEYWNGTIDDVYIYDKVFTEEQIANYYSSETNVLDKSMTSISDDWEMCSIPIHNEYGEGDIVCSGEMTIVDGSPSFENINVTDEIFVGDNVTFNVSIYSETAVDSVWIKIWQGIVVGPVLAMDFLTNIIGNTWQFEITTNESFNLGENNYTIYANTTAGLESNVSGDFNIFSAPLSIVLNSTFGTNLTTENLYCYAELTESDNITYFGLWQKNGVDYFNLTHLYHDDQGGQAWDVWGDGNFVYLANAGDGLEVYSVDSNGTLTHVDSHDPGLLGYGVWGDGDFVYLANYDNGIQVYSVDEFGTLTPVDSHAPGGRGYGVWGDGDFIYLASYLDGLDVYSVDENGTLTHVDNDYNAGRYVDVWGDGDFIYVASVTNGIEVYSVNTSGTLTHIDSDD